MVQLLDGKKVVVEADSYEEALILLKYQDKDNMLIYPQANGKGVHIRLKGKNGEFDEVRVLKVHK